MNRLMLYVFPFGVVVSGVILPLAIIFYWFANNIWTFGQQHFVFGMIEKEEEAKKIEAQERRAANAPPPGAKPKRARKAPTAATDGPSDAEPTGTELGTDGNGRVEHRHAEWWQCGGQPRTAPRSDSAPGRAAQETETLTGAVSGG